MRRTRFTSMSDRRKATDPRWNEFNRAFRQLARQLIRIIRKFNRP